MFVFLFTDLIFNVLMLNVREVFVSCGRAGASIDSRCSQDTERPIFRRLRSRTPGLTPKRG